MRVEVPGFSRLWALSGLRGEGKEEVVALWALLGVGMCWVGLRSTQLRGSEL